MKIILTLMIVWTTASSEELTEKELRDFNKLTTRLAFEGLNKPLLAKTGGIETMQYNFRKARREALVSIQDYLAHSKSFWFRLGQWSVMSNELIDHTVDHRIENDVEPVNDNSVRQQEFLKNNKLNFSYHLIKPTPWEIHATHIPRKVDWRLRNVFQVVTDVHHNCDASYPWGVADTIEAHLKYWNSVSVAMSRQQFLDCPYGNDVRFSGYNPCSDHLFGFNGTPDSVVRAYKFAVLNGMMSRQQYPDNESGKRQTCKLVKDQINSRISGFVIIPNGLDSEVQIMVAVALYGPVTVSFHANIDLDFMRYGGGIYDEPCSIGKMYTMMIVGYGEDNGTAYWLIKNNMGKNWGQYGMIKIARHSVTGCDITRQAIFPVVRANLTSTWDTPDDNYWKNYESKVKSLVDLKYEIADEQELPNTPSLWI